MFKSNRIRHSLRIRDDFQKSRISNLQSPISNLQSPIINHQSSISNLSNLSPSPPASPPFLCSFFLEQPPPGFKVAPSKAVRRSFTTPENNSVPCFTRLATKGGSASGKQEPSKKRGCGVPPQSE
jgi:hypothetical protein